MYTFEIPTVDITFVKDNKESELTSYSSRLLEIQDQIKKESDKDPILKKIKKMLGVSSMTLCNASVYNMKDTRQYWNILEYIYAKNNKKRGCYNDSTSIGWCGYPELGTESIYYTNPDPIEKFNFITYKLTKNKPSGYNINIHDINDLDKNLHHLQRINTYLKVGGAALFIVIGDFNTTNGHLAFPYLLKRFFKKVVVCVTGYCIGIDYNGEILKETTYPSILSESIQPYIQFVKKIRQETITCYELLLKTDKMPFFKQFYTNTMALRKELNILQSKYHSNLFIFIFFHFGINPANYTASYKMIDDKLKSNMYPFPKDGFMLYNLIIDKNLKNVVELGCATGITSAYLLLAIKEIQGHVTSIDPTETTKWDSIGLRLIELMKLKTYHTFIEESFYILAPNILLKKGENRIYDLVYINSYYTFDMTLTDIYFADKFIRVGGYLIIDNYTNDAITTIMMQILSYFKHYERLPLTYASHSIVFKKNKEK
jgi:predicted O-methyltransferase YrrM